MAIARDGHEDTLAAVLASFGERLAFDVDRQGFHVLPEAGSGGRITS
jgi:hypothetical protein